MDPIDLEFVLRALSGGATLVGATTACGALFSGVSTDSRSVAPGDLFVALEGERADGNAFVAEALSRGAAGAIARIGKLELHSSFVKPVLLVRSPLHALGQLASAYRRRLRAQVVAVTGSSGKTTTRDLIHHLLLDPEAGPYAVVRAEKSYNNALGVPLTIFKASSVTRVLVLEVGTSAPGEIASLARIALPDVAVVTNVAAAHLEGLGSIEGVAREKGALVDGLRQWGTAVLNADDARVLAMRERVPETCGALLFGTSGGAQVRGVLLPREDSFRLEVIGGTSAETPPRELAVDLPFPGRHNAMNALAALACVHALGRDIALLGPRLASAKLPGRRLERVRLGPCEVLDDAYNANPASVAAALEVLAAAPAPRIFVFGGMRELGAEREELHREVGKLAARAGLAMFWAIGPDAAIALDSACVSGLAPGTAFRADDAETAADALVPTLEKSGGCVLVKGSRAARLERFIDRLRARLDPTPSGARGELAG